MASPAPLTLEQCERLWEDGYVVLPGVIPSATWRAARRQLMMRLGALQQAALGYSPARPAGLLAGEDGGMADAIERQREVGQLPETLALFEAVRPLLETALGAPITKPDAGQIALNFPTDAGPGINETGWRDDETPWFGWGGHVDGVWNGGTPIPQTYDLFS
jgi:hypothetical protein